MAAVTPAPDITDVSARLRNVLWIYEIETAAALCAIPREKFAALRHVGKVLLAERDAFVARCVAAEERPMSESSHLREQDDPERLDKEPSRKALDLVAIPRISTAHQPSSTSVRDLACRKLPVFTDPQGYGDIVYVGAVNGYGPELPQWFLDIAQWAQGLGYDYVWFDRDADSIPELPFFCHWPED